MTDHIVVFDGSERLTGRTVSVRIADATPYTLFGEVLTNEQIGVACEHEPPATESGRRIGLPLA
jgi:tRNA-2-methylthio-N6-dimethylallyladenosine synthase